MAIIIPISTQWDKKQLDAAVKDINKAGSQLSAINANVRKQSDSFNLFSDGIKKLGIGLVATFGAREIGRFFTSSIKGAMELEAAQNRLRKIKIPFSKHIKIKGNTTNDH
jgi:hypothetical protein